MKYFDCHCDTLVKMYPSGKDFYKNGFDCDLSLLNSEDEAHVVYAVFNDGSYSRRDMLAIFEYFKEKSMSIKNAKAYLSVEGLGNQPDFCIDDIKLYSSYGIRMASLCWNDDNALCGGIGNNSSGLTALGKRVVKELEKYSVIPDVSHASDRTCREIVELSGISVCASHSNSRSICNHPRNLSDSEFKLIAESGGVVGINLYPDFVGKSADIESVILHIEHFLSLNGENNIGLGTDFDGIDKKTAELENCGMIYKLKDKLLAKGYNESFINKIFFENFIELFKKYE